MAYTQADIDRLKTAMATGARRVRFGSGDSAQETEFRSLAEMQQLLSQMQADVSPALAPPMRTVGRYESGLDHGPCPHPFDRGRCS